MHQERESAMLEGVVDNVNVFISKNTRLMVVGQGLQYTVLCIRIHHFQIFSVMASKAVKRGMDICNDYHGLHVLRTSHVNEWPNACEVIWWGKLSMQISVLELATDGAVKMCFLRSMNQSMCIMRFTLAYTIEINMCQDFLN
uniref:Uncharacterized protein n=1 Tax=Parascaris univalens TaxID=6257 RepID=A0A915AXC9_PARUN